MEIRFLAYYSLNKKSRLAAFFTLYFLYIQPATFERLLPNSLSHQALVPRCAVIKLKGFNNERSCLFIYRSH